MKRNDAQPDGRPRLVKLVRDHVARFLGNEGTTTYYPVPALQHAPLLRRKLMEEAYEYVEDPSVGELADVLEVVSALGECCHAVTLADIIVEADRKRAERGGFFEGVGMYVTTTAPPTHEGEHAR